MTCFDIDVSELREGNVSQLPQLVRWFLEAVYRKDHPQRLRCGIHERPQFCLLYSDFALAGSSMEC